MSISVDLRFLFTTQHSGTVLPSGIKRERAARSVSTIPFLYLYIVYFIHLLYTFSAVLVCVYILIIVQCSMFMYKCNWIGIAHANRRLQLPTSARHTVSEWVHVNFKWLKNVDDISQQQGLNLCCIGVVAVPFRNRDSLTNIKTTFNWFWLWHFIK